MPRNRGWGTDDERRAGLVLAALEVIKSTYPSRRLTRLSISSQEESQGSQQISVYVDWDNDGDFDEAIENITDYVQQAHWRLGMQKAFQSVADTSYAEITVTNSDGRFNPENTSSPYDAGFNAVRPHRRVLIGAYEVVEIEIEYSDVTVTFDSGGWPYEIIDPPSWSIGLDPNGHLRGLVTGGVSGLCLQDYIPYTPISCVIRVDLLGEIEVSQVDLAAKFYDPGGPSQSGWKVSGWRENLITPTGYWEGDPLTNDGLWHTYTASGPLSGAGGGSSVMQNTRYLDVQVSGGFERYVAMDNVKIYGDVVQTATEVQERAMWTGWIESIEPEWRPAGAQTGKTTCKLRCNGAVPLLRSTQVQLEEVYEDTTADVVIRRILEMSNLPPSAG